MLEPFTYPITWSARYKAVRAALAGCEVTTPKELCIFMGVDFDDVTSRMESEAARDLRAHGYRREMVPINFYGPLEERWVRHERWPEDAQFD
ncbi:hypothetical protein [Phenylobacterium sp.]|uniref:hypothetical protein n=1 Tax=Phenylobacterium sp. TaxID=1871053 RepID=UPI0035B00C87